MPVCKFDLEKVCVAVAVKVAAESSGTVSAEAVGLIGKSGIPAVDTVAADYGACRYRAVIGFFVGFVFAVARKKLVVAVIFIVVVRKIRAYRKVVKSAVAFVSVKRVVRSAVA